jgi:hypothetical protein
VLGRWAWPGLPRGRTGVRDGLPAEDIAGVLTVAADGGAGVLRACSPRERDRSGDSVQSMTMEERPNPDRFRPDEGVRPREAEVRAVDGVDLTIRAGELVLSWGLRARVRRHCSPWWVAAAADGRRHRDRWRGHRLFDGGRLTEVRRRRWGSSSSRSTSGRA